MKKLNVLNLYILKHRSRHCDGGLCKSLLVETGVNLASKTILQHFADLWEKLALKAFVLLLCENFFTLLTQ